MRITFLPQRHARKTGENSSTSRVKKNPENKTQRNTSLIEKLRNRVMGEKSVR